MQACSSSVVSDDFDPLDFEPLVNRLANRSHLRNEDEFTFPEWGNRSQSAGSDYIGEVRRAEEAPRLGQGKNVVLRYGSIHYLVRIPFISIPGSRKTEALSWIQVSGNGLQDP